MKKQNEWEKTLDRISDDGSHVVQQQCSVTDYWNQQVFPACEDMNT